MSPETEARAHAIPWTTHQRRAQAGFLALGSPRDARAFPELRSSGGADVIACTKNSALADYSCRDSRGLEAGTPHHVPDQVLSDTNALELLRDRSGFGNVAPISCCVSQTDGGGILWSNTYRGRCLKSDSIRVAYNWLLSSWLDLQVILLLPAVH